MMKKRNLKKLIYPLLTLFLLVVLVIGGRGILPAFADTSSYTSPLRDLQKDSNFNVADYPDNAKDFSIQVIQIAEGTTGELFLYTYQPCQKTKYLMATDINMSLSETIDGTKLYGLTFLGNNGVLCKYLVNDVTIKSAAVRYYNISSIYRVWDKDIDNGTGNNNTLDKKAFSVGNIYKVTTENGKIHYACEPTYVVEIINPYVDRLAYYKALGDGRPSVGFIPSFDNWDCLDCHYVAFSTDWEIDRLKSATVKYSYRSVVGHVDFWFGSPTSGSSDYGELQIGYAEPTYSDTVTVSDKRNPVKPNKVYTWNRIQSVSEMVATEENLTEETKKELSSRQWVLRFWETERIQKDTDVFIYKNVRVECVEVTEVAILRLEFESGGISYNIGAVSDMQSGDEFSGNVPKAEKLGFFEYIWHCIVALFTGKASLIEKIVAVVVLLIALLFLPVLITVLSLTVPAFGAIVKKILKGIWTGLKYFFKGLWWLVCLPFKGIKALIDKIRGE